MSKHLDYIRQNRTFFKGTPIAEYIGFNISDFSLLLNELPRISTSSKKGVKHYIKYEIVLPPECQSKLEELFEKLQIQI